MPCTKQTIIGRIKKHRIEKEEQKVIDTLSKLEEAVQVAMPPAIEGHKERTDRLRQEYDKRKLSGEKIETQFRSPRKKFPWTPAIRYGKDKEQKNQNSNRSIKCYYFFDFSFRGLVSEVIQIKEQSYAVIQPRRQTVVEFVDNYLEEKIVPIWPTGWMRKDELRSECDKR